MREVCAYALRRSPANAVAVGLEGGDLVVGQVDVERGDRLEQVVRWGDSR